MLRFVQFLLIVSVLLLSWLLMQAVHEFGHVAVAWATGGTVERIVLHPLSISRTDVEPNPQPLVVVWGGPIIGVLVPLVLWAAVAGRRLQFTWLARFFAGFCLLANGIYIGLGSFQGIGDAGDMLHYGSPRWTLWLFGLITTPFGLALWNGLGPHFGIGRSARPMNSNIAIATATAVLLLALLECLISSR